MRQINVTIPPHVYPFVVYFPDDVFSCLAPLPHPGDEERLLQQIALALLFKEAAKRQINQFMVKKIIAINEPDNKHTHCLLVADYLNQNIESSYFIKQDETFTTTPKLYWETISTETLCKDNVWERLISLLRHYDKTYSNKAESLYKQSKIAPPNLTEPSDKLDTVVFDPKKASQLYEIVGTDDKDIQASLQHRKRRIDISRRDLNESKKAIDELLESASQEDPSYDATKLKAYALLKFYTSGIDALYKTAERNISEESERVEKHPSHSALQTLFDAKFQRSQIDKQPILETIWGAYIGHETWSLFLKKVKAVLAWAVQSAACEYYAEFKKELENPNVVRAYISSYGNLDPNAWVPSVFVKQLTEEEREKFLEKKRQKFNEHFACVDIEISSFGQIIIKNPNLFTNSKLSHLQTLIRTLLEQCNTSYYGQSTKHVIVTRKLVKFAEIINAVIWEEKDTKQPSWLNIKYDELKTHIFTFSDLQTSYDPLKLGTSLQALRNLGGNVQFTWCPTLLTHEEHVEEHCRQLLETIKGTGKDSGLIARIKDDICLNQTGRELLAAADSAIDEARRKTAALRQAIEDQKALLQLQGRVALPASVSEKIVYTEIAGNLSALSVTPSIDTAGLGTEDLLVLEKNATDLQRHAQAAAEEARKVLTQLLETKNSMTAKTIESAQLDLVSMNHFLQQIQTLNTKVDAFTQAKNATTELLQCRSAEEKKLDEYSAELKTMLENFKQNTAPAALTHLSGVISEVRKDFDLSLRSAIQEESDLARALDKQDVNVQEIQMITKALRRATQELTDNRQRVERAIKPAREELAQRNSLHQNWLELLDLIIPIVMDFKYWQSIASADCKTIQVENITYRVPSGIHDLVQIIWNPIYKEYKEQAKVAEALYIEIRKSSKLTSETKTGFMTMFQPKPCLSKDFFQAISTTETDRKAAILTWLNAHKPEFNPVCLTRTSELNPTCSTRKHA